MKVFSVVGDFSLLRDAIIARSEAEPSSHGNHRGGWKSPNTLARWPIANKLMHELERIVGAELDRGAKLEAWAIVHRSNSSHAWHSHGGTWSGIVYLTPGAATVFRVDGAELRVDPMVGSGILFPSDLPHRTDPQPGATARVTVAFNVYMTS